MKIPSLIKFEHNSFLVLCRTVQAVAPEEGCALLLGSEAQPSSYSKETHWRVQLIWPCCNIWDSDKFTFFDSSNGSIDPQKPLTKETRFAIDPREQILAQQWARERNMTLLGSAHSHPHGKSIPSAVDLSSISSPGLMVIVDKSNQAQAWWMEKGQICKPLELVQSPQE